MMLPLDARVELRAILTAITVLAMVAVHWAVLLHARHTKRTSSVTPLAVGLIGALTCALTPGLRVWCWVPLLLDAGCFPLLLVWWRWQRRSQGATSGDQESREH